MKSQNFIKHTLVLWLLLLGVQTIGLCDDPLKLGLVTEQDLKMKVYDKDTSAAAVVLYDYGQSSFLFTKDVQLQFKHTVRIKILKKTGLDEANITIPYFKRGGKEELVTGLKGFTYNLENGKVVKEKLDDAAVFVEKLDGNWYLKKLTMPNVKVGSVVEYTYTIKSDFMSNLREWEFQRNIPVLWSEYRVDMVPFYEYKQVMQGGYPFHVKDASIIRKSAAISYERDLGLTKTQEQGSITMDIVQYRWVMKDVPAFTEEPYLANSGDYICKIEFELSKVQWPEQQPTYVSGNWEQFTTELLKEEEFGGHLNSNPYFKKIAEAVVAGKTTDLDKAKALLAYVHTNMRWDGKNRIYAENLRKAHEKKAGSSAEINLLLTALLREAGLLARPVLVSTRAHGKPLVESPMMSKFNYVICYLSIDGKEYLMDGTEPGLPVGMLPFRCLNDKGWVAMAPKGKWVPLQGQDKNMQMVNAKMEIKPTGEVLGTIEESFLGVPALQMRSKIQGQGEESFLKKFENAGADWTRQGVKIQNLETLDAPLKTEYQLTKTGGVQGGDLLYLSPMLLHGQQENPFKMATRQYPIDFASPIDETYLIHYQLPQGYEIEELPKAAVFSLPNNTAKFTYMTQITDGKLQVMSKLNINKAVFSAREYADLREFFTRVVAKHAEKVVLRKKS
ncbi:MAG: transglutaminase domain-containing protein [Rufibacter sp.]